jgi:serine/threonine protein kinase
VNSSSPEEVKSFYRNELFSFATELLWTAPELLRDSPLREGTAPGDVFSFGIICAELVNKESPWYGEKTDTEIEGNITIKFL